MHWWSFAKRKWPLPYIGAIVAATGISGGLILVLYMSLSKIEAALPNFGFFAIRE